MWCIMVNAKAEKGYQHKFYSEIVQNCKIVLMHEYGYANAYQTLRIRFRQQERERKKHHTQKTVASIIYIKNSLHDEKCIQNEGVNGIIVHLC